MNIGQQPSGIGNGERANAVFSFDVSSLTDPSAIVQANLNLTATSTGNSGTAERQIYAHRLNEDFVEDDVTWEQADDGIDWSGGDDVGAANNTELTQYSLSARSKLESFCDVGFRVSSEPDLDITELVKDAINRRSGTLLLWVGIPLSDVVTTRGLVNVHSPNAVTESNRPKIDVTIAERIVWDGSAGDGNAQTASNWVGDGLPTDSDFVIYNDGAVDVASGGIVCHSLFIAEGYTGDIIQSDGSSILIASSATAINATANINKRRGQFKFNDGVDVSRSVFIANTPTEVCIFETIGTGGSVFVEKTSGELRVAHNSNLVTTGKTHKRVKLTGTQTDVVCGSNTKLILENGCKKLNLFNSKCTCTGGIAFNSANSTISGGGVFNLQNDETANTVNVYNGTITFQNNENAVIETEEIVLWKRGILNTSVGIKSWQPTSTPAIDMKGGNFIVDAGTNITIGN